VYTVKSLEVANPDIADACEWYEKQQKGLSLRFTKEIRRYLDLLSNDPYLFNIRFAGSLRFANLRSFPYFIAYEIDEQTKTVYFHAVFHTSRELRSLKKR
jgi:hypothetical protein